MQPRVSLACCVLALVVVSSACAGGGDSSAAGPPGPIAQDLPSLVKAAPLIVVANVTAVQPGRTAGEGEGQLQFNDVQLSVEKALKGRPPARLVVEQVSTTGRKILTPGVGPAYERGQRYLLFVRPGEGHRYVPVGQGRYLLETGTVRSLGPGPVADRLNGMDERKLTSEIEAVVRG